MASLAPYLPFPGNCREALSFYQSCLGGDLNLMRVGDVPEAAANTPAEAHDRIMHGSLVAGPLTLLASDALDPRHPPAPGSNVALCLNCTSDDEITSLFGKLGEGGTVTDPLADMFWGGKFGSLTDRFGMYWLFNFDRAVGE